MRRGLHGLRHGLPCGVGGGFRRSFATHGDEAKSFPRVLAVEGAKEIGQRIRELKPQQVMLETCEERLSLSKSSGSQDVVKDEKDREALSHADAIAFVHGGLRLAELQSSQRAAEEVGAQVYCVDRSYRETQNRVAKRLLLHPKEMLGFARFAAANLGGATELGGEDAFQCPAPVAEILGEERERHMASEALKHHVTGATALLLCSPARSSSLQQLLETKNPEAMKETSSTSRVWPFLLVLVYVVIPGYGTVYLFWRMAKGLGDWISSLLRPSAPDEASETGRAPAER